MLSSAGAGLGDNTAKTQFVLILYAVIFHAIYTKDKTIPSLRKICGREAEGLENAVKLTSQFSGNFALG